MKTPIFLRTKSTVIRDFYRKSNLLYFEKLLTFIFPQVFQPLPNFIVVPTLADGSKTISYLDECFHTHTHFSYKFAKIVRLFLLLFMIFLFRVVFSLGNIFLCALFHPPLFLQLITVSCGSLNPIGPIPAGLFHL